MESMVGARHFSCMDLKSGFWQVQMDEESRQYTGLKLKPSKCNFFRTEISYLGHKVSAAGMEPGTDGLKGIAEIAPRCHLYSGTKVLGCDGVFPMLHKRIRQDR